MVAVEQLTGPVAEHGEGPVWVDGLLWVDMLAGDLLTLTADGGVRRRHLANVLGAVRPRAQGGLVFGVERGFALADGPDGPLRPLPELWCDPGIRMNEGSCDPDGRFWCGSMAYDQRPGAGAVYRLEADLSAHLEFGDVTVSNGLEWLPDGSGAYYVDSPTGRVDRFDYASDAGLSGRRAFVHVDGRPDGLAVDSEGGVWVALWGGGAVHHYTSDGVLADVVEVPAPNVTACTFGGPGLRSLYITTSRLEAPGGAGDPSGSVFRLEDAGVAGLPARAFGG